MLVEINLLPQKESNKRTSHVILAVFIIILLLVGGYFFWQVHTVKGELATVEKQLALTETAIAKANAASTAGVDQTDSAAKLKTAIEWANAYPIESIPIIQNLTKLLPERGFIQSFNYTETGVISLSVQFDLARDAAYFLTNISEEKWISEANMISVTADESATANVNQTETLPTPNTNEDVDQYLPRYLAQYEIKLDRNNVKLVKEKEKENEQEGESES